MNDIRENSGSAICLQCGDMLPENHGRMYCDKCTFDGRKSRRLVLIDFICETLILIMVSIILTWGVIKLLYAVAVGSR